MFRLPRLRGVDMADRVTEGVWVGKHPESDEHLLIKDNVLHCSVEFRPISEEQYWNRSVVRSICIEPGKIKYEVDPKIRSDIIAPEPVVVQDDPEEAKYKRHWIHFQRSDFEVHQYSSESRK